MTMWFALLALALFLALHVLGACLGFAAWMRERQTWAIWIPAESDLTWRRRRFRRDIERLERTMAEALTPAVTKVAEAITAFGSALATAFDRERR
jgi:hypothetical protein